LFDRHPGEGKERNLLTYFSPEQQDELAQPHVGSLLPVRAARIIAAAHPTPLSTVMASTGQLS